MRTDDLDVAAKEATGGVRTEHAAAAAQGKTRVKKAKAPRPFGVYCRAGEVMLSEGTSQGIFGHCVMTTMWNLMARVKNGVGLCRTHFDVEGDALLIYYAQEKTDHQGRKGRDPRHVYANPFKPEICPILSLGLYFVLIDVTTLVQKFVFPGKAEDVAKAFNDYLRKVVESKEKMGEFVEPEVKRGSHSLRKGAATFVSSGGTNAPSHAAISNRGGWSIGSVQKIYLQ